MNAGPHHNVSLLQPFPLNVLFLATKRWNWSRSCFNYPKMLIILQKSRSYEANSHNWGFILGRLTMVNQYLRRYLVVWIQVGALFLSKLNKYHLSVLTHISLTQLDRLYPARIHLLPLRSPWVSLLRLCRRPESAKMLGDAWVRGHFTRTFYSPVTCHCFLNSSFSTN